MPSFASHVRVLVLLSLASPVAAATLTRGPYLQLVDADSATIVWNTDVAAECSLAIRRRSGGAVTVISGAVGTVCAMPVANLAAGTVYGYTPRADGAALRSESFFQTDDPAEPYTFLVVGDTGSG